MLSDDLEGRDGKGGSKAQEGGDIYIYIYRNKIYIYVETKTS